MAAEPKMLLLAISNSTLSENEKKCVAFVADTNLVQLSFAVEKPANTPQWTNLIHFLHLLSDTALQQGHQIVGGALNEIVAQSVLDPDFGGYGLSADKPLTKIDEANVVFLCSAIFEAVKAELRARHAPKPLDHRPEGRRGMTMAEKIFAMHDVSNKGWVQPGDVIQVDVDWVLASELTWKSISATYKALGRPGVFRNDRFWLAGDHRVEPPLYEQPAVKNLMVLANEAKEEFKMTDFQGFNYTIMHTEFVRERAQPGMLCIGADSHSCSAGAASCLSIGLGATDVAMPLITGQTWFTVPETVSLKMINAPPKGIGGKDTILYILQQFKRNTIASDRVVEFSGPGLKHLSCDARFAIANMCTEFGAVTGIFEADEQTLAYVNRRHQKKHKDKAVYYRPDEDAIYAEQHIIDLSQVESFVAICPSPDDVVPVSGITGQHLDGCFIGACTTAEEDLIIGAMVLESGMKKGLTPVKQGRRLVVPGSRPISRKLENLGFLDIYRRAGFKIGVPGCSMCVGQGTDQAQAGETWLSSQNRNFKNRMGPGSIANISSAATVAASSFDMQITDPRELLEDIDLERLQDILARRAIDSAKIPHDNAIRYQEPYSESLEKLSGKEIATKKPDAASSQFDTEILKNSPESAIEGCALVLGDFIDTDAIIPSKFLAAGSTDEELGPHCMEFFMPEFREKVRNGQSIVVAGRSFGVGSSRDVAVNALKGSGVKAVIARSFAFIYARNQPNLGLLGISIRDEAFYELAIDGEPVRIDLDSSTVECGGRTFGFKLSDMEKQLIAAGGMTEAFRQFGRNVFNKLCTPVGKPQRPEKKGDLEDSGDW